MDQLAAWLERHDVTVLTLLMTLALLVGASAAILLLQRLLEKWLRQLQARVQLPYEIGLTITRAVTATLWLITLMLVLGLWGISVGGLWTLLVSAAAVIGVGFLATWTMVSNVTASLFITIWRPFHLGDSVELLPEKLQGRVVDRNLMFVVLRQEDGAAITIPNNLFFQKPFRVSDGGSKFPFEALDFQAGVSDGKQPM